MVTGAAPKSRRMLLGDISNRKNTLSPSFLTYSHEDGSKFVIKLECPVHSTDETDHAHSKRDRIDFEKGRRVGQ
jgi:hypothetical protein